MLWKFINTCPKEINIFYATLNFCALWSSGVSFANNLFKTLAKKFWTDSKKILRENKVIMGTKRSQQWKLTNRLLQGFLVVHPLFSIYIVDMPAIRSCYFGYADNWFLSIGHKSCPYKWSDNMRLVNISKHAPSAT